LVWIFHGFCHVGFHDSKILNRTAAACHQHSAIQW
jgi:hypothetical protein